MLLVKTSFHRKLWGLIFTLVIIKIFELSRDFISKMTFWVTASVQSKLEFAIIAFDVCSVAFFSFLTSVAVNYPGKLPTQWRLLPQKQWYQRCQRQLYTAEGVTAKLASKDLLTLKYMIFFSTLYAHCHMVLSSSSISDLHWIPKLLLLWAKWFLIVQRLQMGKLEDR